MPHRFRNEFGFGQNNVVRKTRRKHAFDENVILAKEVYASIAKTHVIIRHLGYLRLPQKNMSILGMRWRQLLHRGLQN